MWLLTRPGEARTCVACSEPHSTPQAPSAPRITSTFCATVRPAVSITRGSPSHASYSRRVTSSQVGNSNPGMSLFRVSTRRRCSSTSEHSTSISIAPTPARLNRDPRLARDAKRIHRVGNDRSANSEIVFCHGVRNAGPRIIDRPVSGRAHGLLDRIDPQVYRAGETSQFHRDGRLSHAWQAPKDNQHLAASPLAGCLARGGT